MVQAGKEGARRMKYFSETRLMCLFMEERGMLTLCSFKGVTATIKCFPNSIKNAALKRMWGRRLCERDTRVRKGRNANCTQEGFLLSLLGARYNVVNFKREKQIIFVVTDFKTGIQALWAERGFLQNAYSYSIMHMTMLISDRKKKVKIYF